MYHCSAFNILLILLTVVCIIPLSVSLLYSKAMIKKASANGIEIDSKLPSFIKKMGVGALVLYFFSAIVMWYLDSSPIIKDICCEPPIENEVYGMDWELENVNTSQFGITNND